MKKAFYSLGLSSLFFITGSFAQMGMSDDDFATTPTIPNENETVINSGDAAAIDTLSLLEGSTLEETGEITGLEAIEEEVITTESELKSSAGIPGVLPSSTEIVLSVVNISQENKDATVVGARPGDLLRYELKLKSDTEDVMAYITEMDVRQMLSGVDFTNIGLAELDRTKGAITFPEYTHKAPCEQIFTIFAQVKPDCGDLKSLKLNAGGKSITVRLSCGLVPTGSFSTKNLLFGALAVMFMVAFGFGMRRNA